MDEPFLESLTTLPPPEEEEAKVREALPPWQRNYTSDDYVDYTWHTPTVLLYTARATLKLPEAGYQYPEWVKVALGGYRPTTDPTVTSAPLLPADFEPPVGLRWPEYVTTVRGDEWSIPEIA